MGRERRGRRVVVWPVYIDSTVSRGMGRKISVEKAVRKPTIEEVVKAAEELGLNPEVEEAGYPRNWSSYRARVIVDKRGSKLRILEDIAATIKRMRETKARKQRK